MPDFLNPPNGLLKSRIIEELIATTPVRMPCPGVIDRELRCAGYDNITAKQTETDECCRDATQQLRDSITNRGSPCYVTAANHS